MCTYRQPMPWITAHVRTHVAHCHPPQFVAHVMYTCWAQSVNRGTAWPSIGREAAFPGFLESSFISHPRAASTGASDLPNGAMENGGQEGGRRASHPLGQGCLTPLLALSAEGCIYLCHPEQSQCRTVVSPGSPRPPTWPGCPPRVLHQPHMVKEAASSVPRETSGM